MQRFEEMRQSSHSAVPASGEAVAPGAVSPSNKQQQRDTDAETQRLARDVRIEAALDMFRAADSALRKTMLEREEAARVENVAWSRALDSKVSPVLAVAGLALAGIPTLLKDFVRYGDTPVAALLVAAAVPFLLYAVVRSVVTVSPTLKLAEPVKKFFGLLHLFGERHIAHPPSDEKPGRLYFGHLAQHPDLAASIKAAVAYYADESLVFRDTVSQNENNAKLCVEKCVDIAMAVRGILIAVFLLLVAGLFFALHR